MSGIVGIVNTKGAAVDITQIERLTAALAFRGPDRQATWHEAAIGFGHTLFATTRGAAREQQPASLGDGVWISADVRIDGRAELWTKLGIDHTRGNALTDVELVMHAYRTWGEDCVAQLLGDFAFMIWDGPRQKLFCARDPFGVKLFYYTQTRHDLVLSNTLNCLLMHPDVSRRLNDVAAGNHLLWGGNWDITTTIYQDVAALPAGHTLTWRPGEPLRVQRYFELPPEQPPLRYSDRRDYIDHFRVLLDAAVDDRLRTSRVSVWMSGGVDSPMLAAVARARSADSSPAGVFALTQGFDELFADPEPRFAKLAARHLDIPLEYFAGDEFYSSWQWLRLVASPEPATLFSKGISMPGYESAAAHGKVAFTGFDGDAMLAMTLSSLWRGRLRRFELGSLAREAAWHARRGRLPRVGIRSTLYKWRNKLQRHAVTGYPPWLAPEFEERTKMRQRWQEFHEPSTGSSPRAKAYGYLSNPGWRSVMDELDPGATGVLLEHRHPLIDLRLVNFALALPPVPWCVDKELFRAAMRGVLPASVVERPKAPLAGDPAMESAARFPNPLANGTQPAAQLAEYVDVKKYRVNAAQMPTDSALRARFAWHSLWTLTLDGWLYNSGGG